WSALLSIDGPSIPPGSAISSQVPGCPISHVPRPFSPIQTSVRAEQPTSDWWDQDGSSDSLFSSDAEGEDNYLVDPEEAYNEDDHYSRGLEISPEHSPYTEFPEFADNVDYFNDLSDLYEDEETYGFGDQYEHDEPEGNFYHEVGTVEYDDDGASQCFEECGIPPDDSHCTEFDGFADNTDGYDDSHDLHEDGDNYNFGSQYEYGDLEDDSHVQICDIGYNNDETGQHSDEPQISVEDSAHLEVDEQGDAVLSGEEYAEYDDGASQRSDDLGIPHDEELEHSVDDPYEINQPLSEDDGISQGSDGGLYSDGENQLDSDEEDATYLYDEAAEFSDSQVFDEPYDDNDLYGDEEEQNTCGEHGEPNEYFTLVPQQFPESLWPLQSPKFIRHRLNFIGPFVSGSPSPLNNTLIDTLALHIPALVALAIFKDLLNSTRVLFVQSLQLSRQLVSPIEGIDVIVDYREHLLLPGDNEFDSEDWDEDIVVTHDAMDELFGVGSASIFNSTSEEVSAAAVSQDSHSTVELPPHSEQWEHPNNHFMNRNSLFRWSAVSYEDEGGQLDNLDDDKCEGYLALVPSNFPSTLQYLQPPKTRNQPQSWTTDLAPHCDTAHTPVFAAPASSDRVGMFDEEAATKTASNQYLKRRPINEHNEPRDLSAYHNPLNGFCSTGSYVCCTHNDNLDPTPSNHLLAISSETFGSTESFEQKFYKFEAETQALYWGTSWNKKQGAAYTIHIGFGLAQRSVELGTPGHPPSHFPLVVPSQQIISHTQHAFGVCSLTFPGPIKVFDETVRDTVSNQHHRQIGWGAYSAPKRTTACRRVPDFLSFAIPCPGHIQDLHLCSLSIPNGGTNLWNSTTNPIGYHTTESVPKASMKVNNESMRITLVTDKSNGQPRGKESMVLDDSPAFYNFHSTILLCSHIHRGQSSRYLRRKNEVLNGGVKTHAPYFHRPHFFLVPLPYPFRLASQHLVSPPSPTKSHNLLKPTIAADGFTTYSRRRFCELDIFSIALNWGTNESTVCVLQDPSAQQPPMQRLSNDVPGFPSPTRLLFLKGLCNVRLPVSSVWCSITMERTGSDLRVVSLTSHSAGLSNTSWPVRPRIQTSGRSAPEPQYSRISSRILHFPVTRLLQPSHTLDLGNRPWTFDIYCPHPDSICTDATQKVANCLIVVLKRGLVVVLTSLYAKSKDQNRDRVAHKNYHSPTTRSLLTSSHQATLVTISDTAWVSERLVDTDLDEFGVAAQALYSEKVGGRSQERTRIAIGGGATALTPISACSSTKALVAFPPRHITRTLLSAPQPFSVSHLHSLQVSQPPYCSLPPLVHLHIESSPHLSLSRLGAARTLETLVCGVELTIWAYATATQITPHEKNTENRDGLPNIQESGISDYLDRRSVPREAAKTKLVDGQPDLPPTFLLLATLSSPSYRDSKCFITLTSLWTKFDRRPTTAEVVTLMAKNQYVRWRTAGQCSVPDILDSSNRPQVNQPCQHNLPPTLFPHIILPNPSRLALQHLKTPIALVPSTSPGARLYRHSLLDDTESITAKIQYDKREENGECNAPGTTSLPTYPQPKQPAQSIMHIPVDLGFSYMSWRFSSADYIGQLDNGLVDKIFLIWCDPMGRQRNGQHSRNHAETSNNLLIRMPPTRFDYSLHISPTQIGDTSTLPTLGVGLITQQVPWHNFERGGPQMLSITSLLTRPLNHSLHAFTRLPLIMPPNSLVIPYHNLLNVQPWVAQDRQLPARGNRSVQKIVQLAYPKLGIEHLLLRDVFASSQLWTFCTLDGRRLQLSLDSKVLIRLLARPVVEVRVWMVTMRDGTVVVNLNTFDSRGASPTSLTEMPYRSGQINHGSPSIPHDSTARITVVYSRVDSGFSHTRRNSSSPTNIIISYNGQRSRNCTGSLNDSPTRFLPIQPVLKPPIRLSPSVDNHTAHESPQLAQLAFERMSLDSFELRARNQCSLIASILTNPGIFDLPLEIAHPTIVGYKHARFRFDVSEGTPAQFWSCLCLTTHKMDLEIWLRTQTLMLYGDHQQRMDKGTRVHSPSNQSTTSLNDPSPQQPSRFTTSICITAAERSPSPTMPYYLTFRPNPFIGINSVTFRGTFIFPPVSHLEILFSNNSLLVSSGREVSWTSSQLDYLCVAAVRKTHSILNQHQHVSGLVAVALDAPDADQSFHFPYHLILCRPLYPSVPLLVASRTRLATEGNLAWLMIEVGRQEGKAYGMKTRASCIVIEVQSVGPHATSDKINHSSSQLPASSHSICSDPQSQSLIPCSYSRSRNGPLPEYHRPSVVWLSSWGTSMGNGREVRITSSEPHEAPGIPRPEILLLLTPQGHFHATSAIISTLLFPSFHMIPKLISAHLQNPFICLQPCPEHHNPVSLLSLLDKIIDVELGVPAA
ncbi:hypothetical protein PQX77_019320, partial [Marasmius sp. AFHP31]